MFLKRIRSFRYLDLDRRAINLIINNNFEQRYDPKMFYFVKQIDFSARIVDFRPVVKPLVLDHVIGFAYSRIPYDKGDYLIRVFSAERRGPSMMENVK